MPENIPFIQSYHARTRHHFEAYAAGPGQLDWDAQPAPFRHFHGAPCLSLPLSADQFERPWHDPAPTAAVPTGLDSIGAVLELSFGLSAWKSWGPSRWALRCNPSSGNLHPTESYLLCRGIPGLADGVHHYDPLQHQLESRALLNPGGSPCLLLGLSSIMWREAWKYGERAFRYCQLDLGHALGAIAYAAHLLGWQARPLALGSERLAKLLGLNRSEDFPSTPYPFTEAEEPEILLALQAPGLPPPSPGQLQALEAELQAASWQGQASLIDPDPGYRWPLIDQAAQASRLPDDWLAWAAWSIRGQR
ncbi:SagB/ThcOx family dehydrogenase [Halomonas ventosae]|uniref:SagB-type dehydrogenase family enzyme n=1 Tax=Halomonas ventosae TaxID=229007 RepID=A0A4R6GM50_9GAMM|nr:SagB/ThcOx family dehydrogenase [Halomonas ventosae]TDN95375.1 SagB-type dehydrogenase family enzyme [Halomonas ventosae]